MDLNKLITTIQGLSDTDNDLKQLKTLLNKYEEVLVKNSNLLEEALNTLDPNRHSLGWLYILSVRAAAPRLDPQRFISHTQVFLQNSNPQHIRLAPSRFAKVCRKFTELLIEVRQPMRGIVPLRTAIAAISDDTKHLTPLHTDFVQLCLLAKCYRTALPVVDDEVFEVSTEATGLTPKDLLCYYYYGGRVYIGLKQYKKALEFFKLVFTAPAIVLSAIMVEAYKKFVLVSLIVHGQVTSIPKYTSSVVHRHIKNAAAPYQELANAYLTHSTEDVQKCIAGNAETFQKEGNFGLAKQCLRALYNANIKRHTQTYLTLSLHDIADSTKLGSVGEVETTLLRMIEENEIFASINQKDGMVAFQEDPEHYNTNKMMQYMDAQIHKSIALERKLKTVDDLISLNPNYVQRTTGHDRHARWAAGDIDDYHDMEKGMFPSDKSFPKNF
jgi:COP9 signalosome complex subunit 3